MVLEGVVCYKACYGHRSGRYGHGMAWYLTASDARGLGEEVGVGADAARAGEDLGLLAHAAALRDGHDPACQ
jgi:hypothetical protein